MNKSNNHTVTGIVLTGLFVLVALIIYCAITQPLNTNHVDTINYKYNNCVSNLPDESGSTPTITDPYLFIYDSLYNKLNKVNPKGYYKCEYSQLTGCKYEHDIVDDHGNVVHKTHKHKYTSNLDIASYIDKTEYHNKNDLLGEHDNIKYLFNKTGYQILSSNDSKLISKFINYCCKQIKAEKAYNDSIFKAKKEAEQYRNIIKYRQDMNISTVDVNLHIQ